MNVSQLQTRLAATGNYKGAIDGLFGPLTRQAILDGMEDGPDLQLNNADFVAAASRLDVEKAAIMAISDVEASGAAFTNGKPTILFEPHRFSKATGHRYDGTHPTISSRTWNKTLYPLTQAGRWKQVLDACALDVDAAFASASYGRFQILAENYAVCGARDPFAFAWQESRTEGDQLEHFIRFVEGRGLVDALRRRDWAVFARGYNGTAFAANSYDKRLKAAYERRLSA
jgi:hypothetical protein